MPLSNRAPVNAAGSLLVTTTIPTPAWPQLGGMTYDPTTGELAVIDAVPAATDPWVGGIRFTNLGSMYIVTSVPPLLFYVGGIPVSPDGRVYMTGSPPIGASGGWPVAGDGGVAGSNPTLFPSFWAPLGTSLFPNLGPYPTFTRATFATTYNSDGNVRQVLPNEARFAGARRVANNFVFSEGHVANWAPPGSGGTKAEIAYGGKSSVIALGFPANGPTGLGQGGNFGGGTIYFGHYYHISVWVALSRPLTGTESIGFWGASGSGFNGPHFLLTAAVQPGTALQRMAANAPVGSPVTTVGGTGLFIYPQTTITSPLTVYVWGWQLEDVSGQANQAPGEYVSMGVLATPYNGAGVDGVKYFNTTNGNSVVGNMVAEGVGSPLSSFYGFHCEPADTNKMLRSDDMANWTRTNCTVGINVPGAPDGSDNAFLFTDNATAGVHKFLEGTGLVSVVGSYNNWSVFAKAGTMPWFQLAIDDNGTVWYANFNLQTGTVGSSNGYTAGMIPLANGWYRCYLSKHGTVSTPTAFPQICGLPGNVATPLPTYPGTGQTVLLWGPQFESGPLYPLTYIPTTTVAVTRNAETLDYAYGVDGVTGTSYVEVIPALTSSQRDLLYDANGKTIQYYVTGVANYPENVQTVNTPNIGVPNKSASAWGALTCSMDLNGGPIATGAYVNAGTVPPFYVGRGTGGPWTGLIRNVKIFPAKFTDAQLQAITV